MSEALIQATTLQPPDKLFDHHRQQLSAMLDGALSPDEARFMLRRLQHDTELAACWERWQVCGDVLRGQRNALLPSDFAQCVSRAIVSDRAVPAVTAAVARPRWARWGGGAALAASVAVAALFVARQSPNAIDRAVADVPTQIVAASSPLNASGVETPAPSKPAAPDASSQLAVAVAAELPRRAAAARRLRAQNSPGQGRRAIRTASRVAEPSALVATGNAAAIASAVGNSNADPFAAQVLTSPSRPWPRAILPSYPAAGAFNVDFGSAGVSFYPFDPRVTGHGDAGASGQGRAGDSSAPPQP